MGLYIGNEKIGGGLITKVNALPEANATNYAKNQLYLYENKLYFIVLDGSTYKMKKLGEDAPSGYSVTVRYSGPYSMTVYDGTDTSGTKLAESIADGVDVQVTCLTGSLFFDVVGGALSTTGTNGATSTNPSTITSSGASIVVTGGHSGG